MKLNRMSGMLVLFITVTAFIAFAQEPEDSGPAASTMPAADLAQATIQNEADTQWAWGEVTSLDSQAKMLTLKYFDYETDQEKELVLTVDEKTVYENIRSFDEIKVKDTLSIDYAAGPENKNIAKNISLEKPDALAPAPQHPALSEEPVRASAQQPAVNVSQPSVIEIPVPEKDASQAHPEAAGGPSAEVTEPSQPAPASPAPEPEPVQTQ